MKYEQWTNEFLLSVHGKRRKRLEEEEEVVEEDKNERYCVSRHIFNANTVHNGMQWYAIETER